MIGGLRRGRNGREARLTGLLALAVVLALPLLGAAPASPPGAPPQGQSTPGQALPAIASGPAPDLDLLFTAQVAGWIEPCG